MSKFKVCFELGTRLRRTREFDRGTLTYDSLLFAATSVFADVSVKQLAHAFNGTTSLRALSNDDHVKAAIADAEKQRARALTITVFAGNASVAPAATATPARGTAASSSTPSAATASSSSSTPTPTPTPTPAPATRASAPAAKPAASELAPGETQVAEFDLSAQEGAGEKVDVKLMDHGDKIEVTFGRSRHNEHSTVTINNTTLCIKHVHTVDGDGGVQTQHTLVGRVGLPWAPAPSAFSVTQVDGLPALHISKN